VDESGGRRALSSSTCAPLGLRQSSTARVLEPWTHPTRRRTRRPPSRPQSCAVAISRPRPRRPTRLLSLRLERTRTRTLRLPASQRMVLTARRPTARVRPLPPPHLALALVSLAPSADPRTRSARTRSLQDPADAQHALEPVRPALPQVGASLLLLFLPSSRPDPLRGRLGQPFRLVQAEEPRADLCNALVAVPPRARRTSTSSPCSSSARNSSSSSSCRARPRASSSACTLPCGASRTTPASATSCAARASTAGSSRRSSARAGSTSTRSP